MMINNLSIRFLTISFILILLSGCQGFKYAAEKIIYAGQPGKKLKISINTIFPLGFEVSTDNYIYFSFLKNNKGISILKYNLETDSIYQITPDGFNAIFGIPSHSGKKVLFQRGPVFGSNNSLYTMDSNGMNIKEIFYKKNMYLSDTIWSLNDETIYFIAGYCDNNNLNYKYCQDIFSIDSSGNNLKRLTSFYITGWITNLYLSENGSAIFFDAPNENWSPNTFTYLIKNYLNLIRAPFNGGIYKLSLDNFEIQEISFSLNEETFPKDFDTDYLPGYSLFSTTNNKRVFKYDYTGIYEYDYINGTVSCFIDSVNGIPFQRLPDSIRIYNPKITFDEKKLVAGIGDIHNYHLVVFDIETKKIERNLTIDSTRIVKYITD